MGLILIETEDEVSEAQSDTIEMEARRIMGKEFRNISWFYNAETEPALVRMFYDLLEESRDG